MPLSTLNVVLKATTSSFEQAMARSKASLKGLQASVSPALNSIRNLTTSFGALATAALGIGSIGAGIGFGVKMAAEAESMEVAFTTMLKSGDKAKSLLDDLNKFAADTPFEFPELADAGRKLVAFGVDSQKVVGTLRRIGDVSSGVGQPIGEIAELFGKAKVQGRLFAEDINQLTGRGIPIIGELAKQFKVTQGEVRKLVETGRVNFSHLEQAFINLTSSGGQFAEMMAKQAETLNGRWSTFKDTFGQTMKVIGEQLITTFDLKNVVSGMSAFLQFYKDDIVKGVTEGLQIIKDVGLASADWIDYWIDGFVQLQQKAVEAVGIIAKAYLGYREFVEEHITPKGWETPEITAGLKSFTENYDVMTKERAAKLKELLAEPPPSKQYQDWFNNLKNMGKDAAQKFQDQLKKGPTVLDKLNKLRVKANVAFDDAKWMAGNDAGWWGKLVGNNLNNFGDALRSVKEPKKPEPPKIFDDAGSRSRSLFEAALNGKAKTEEKILEETKKQREHVAKILDQVGKFALNFAGG